MVYMASVKKSGTLTWTNIVLHSAIILLGASNFIAQFFIWIERWSLWPAAGWRQQTRCHVKYKWEFAKSQENKHPLVFTPQKDLTGGDTTSSVTIISQTVVFYLTQKKIIKILLIGSIVPLANSLVSLIRFMLSFLLLWNCLQIYFQTMLWWMP